MSSHTRVVNRTTLFSLIALVIVILGFTYYESKKTPDEKSVISSPLPKPTATPIPPTEIPSITITESSDSNASASAAAAGFYDWYNKCMQNPPGEAAGQVGLYCQNHNPYGSYDLARNLEASGVAQAGADPIICAQNPPRSTKVTSVKTQAGKTITTIAEAYGSGDTVEIKVTMTQENGDWKVNAISCPRP